MHESLNKANVVFLIKKKTVQPRALLEFIWNSDEQSLLGIL